MEESPQESVRRLEAGYGRTVTAVVSGTRQRADVNRWICGETTPSEEQLHRIRETLRILKIVEDAEGPRIAAAWILGANTHHNDERVTPMAAIREDNFAAAESSARRLVGDIWD